MVGGDLHWIWEPYGLYQEVDYVCLVLSGQVWVITLTITFGYAGDRYMASRLCKKTTDLPTLSASSYLSRSSLDALT